MVVWAASFRGARASKETGRDGSCVATATAAVTAFSATAVARVGFQTTTAVLV